MTMRNVVVGTAGHIDHGKSALVLALTGTDPDRLKEEKARGITIDLGFAHSRTADVNIAFVDVPGHERFVRNMLAGVGGIDAVLLVVAADESVMPQTREHFEICRLLHVPAGIVALTKADLVDAEVLDLVRLETRGLVTGSFLEHAPMIAVSSRTGQGLDELREALRRLAASIPSRPSEGPVRLPIDRVFSMKGFGTVVTGTLVSGRIRQDDDLVLLPRGRRVKIRGIQVHRGEEAEAFAGQRVAANLVGVEVGEIARGETLVEAGAFVPTRLVDTRVEIVGNARPLKHGARVRLHQGTSEILGRAALAGQERMEIAPGSDGYVRLRLESPAVLTRGDRFILRSYSPPLTIGGGIVLDPQPPLRAGVRRPAGAARFACLDPAAEGHGDASDDAIRIMLADAGAAGLASAALTSRVGLDPAERAARIQHLVERREVVVAGERLVAPTEIAMLEQHVLETLGEHHRLEPLVEGMPREELRERLFARAGPAVFEYVLERLVAARKVVARDRVALAGHRIALSQDDQKVSERLEALFAASGLRPPEVAALASALGSEAGVIDRVVGLLLRQRTLVRVGTLVFHERALQGLKAEVSALKRAASGETITLDVAGFKERFRVTRKFAIPLLEYLDRERVTRRVGDVRVIL
jgi:selenocysteine-specific elongation factor